MTIQKTQSKIKAGRGTRLWQEAKMIIPGGNQLLSKRSEQFLPNQWPSYFKTAKGIKVTDLDNQQYLDFSHMSVGTCTLGYANQSLNNAVTKAIRSGIMTTLNCPEEVLLAKKLIKLHPWSQQVRFSKTGGEACTIAVRIARAATRKDGVAFCGYHGWHDWYLSSNLESAHHLDQQLLPGLAPAGVPQNLRGTAFPFTYGDAESFEKIISEQKDKIGTVIMEVVRYKPINIPFLKEIQRIARQNKIVLIFDEVTSGFRERVGALHINHGLEPDMVVLGKALGNGFSISAIAGKKAVMDHAQDTFISSTYWTERIGFTAALEVIRQYEENNVPRHLTAVGKMIKKGWAEIFSQLSLNIEVAGLDAIPAMTIKEKDPLKLKTYFTQEMLKRGYLASTSFFASIDHKKPQVQQYLKNAAQVFKMVKESIDNQSLDSKLQGPVCHSHFTRLN